MGAQAVLQLCVDIAAKEGVVMGSFLVEITVVRAASGCMLSANVASHLP